MGSRSHWESIYASKAATSLSWYQEHAECSLSLLRNTGVSRSAAIIDVGGGASMLVDDLLATGYSDVSVLDISRTALSLTRKRLGRCAGAVQWLEADVTEASLPEHRYDVWHDRAVFHFLTEPSQRQAYVEAMRRTVKPGGHVIVAAFAEDGPPQCSGLPVMRYAPEELHAQFGDALVLVEHVRQSHYTPSGVEQKFVYCHCRVAVS